MRRTGIVGLGAVGSNLARALHAMNYPIHCIISHSATPRHPLAIEINAKHVIPPGAPIPPGLELLFLCVPDDAIQNVSKQLSELPYSWEGVVVAHTSGALSASALSSLKEKNAYTFSFHPVQTFAQEVKTRFDDIFIGIEGDPEATQVGVELAERLNATPVVLSTPDKALYHAAAVIASNFFVTLSSIAMDLLEQTGLNRQQAQALLAPLIQTTCHNVIHSLPEKVLTGPASRADQATIERHLNALEEHLPQYYTMYHLMTKHTLHLAERGNMLSEEQLSRMLDQLSLEQNE